MARERPTIVTVMAILNMVIGGLGLLCGFCGLGAHLVIAGLGSTRTVGGGPNPIQDMLAYLNRELPGYQAIEIGRGALVLILGIVLIAAGIGLLMVQNWARWVSLVYGILSILLHTGYVVYELAFVKPATERWQKLFLQKQGLGALPPQSPAESLGTTVGVIGAGAVFIIYSLVLLVILFLPAFSAAFTDRPRKRRRRYEEEEYDDSDDRGYDDREEDEDRGRYRPKGRAY